MVCDTQCACFPFFTADESSHCICQCGMNKIVLALVLQNFIDKVISMVDNQCGISTTPVATNADAATDAATDAAVSPLPLLSVDDIPST